MCSNVPPLENFGTYEIIYKKEPYLLFDGSDVLYFTDKKNTFPLFTFNSTNSVVRKCEGLKIEIFVGLEKKQIKRLERATVYKKTRISKANPLPIPTLTVGFENEQQLNECWLLLKDSMENILEYSKNNE